MTELAWDESVRAMVDRPYDHRGDRLREIAEKYELLNDATRERIREISERLNALSGDLESLWEGEAQPTDQH